MKAVLILEDDAAIRESLKLVLELAGLHVRMFGTSAGLLADSSLAEAGCILLGHHPPALNGLETAARIGTLPCHGPMILMTDNAQATLLRHAARLKIVRVIERPFFGSVLIEHVSEVLAGAAGPT